MALLLAAAVRLPFWLEALHTPLSADASITGLMAMHPGVGSTFWGQPYGSPLEGWLLAPLLALPVSGALALRGFYFALGLLLVPLGYALGRALDPRAALPAALLMACPSPYLLVLAALPPPLYPLSLVFCGLLLVWGLRLGARLRSGSDPGFSLCAWGALAGLALWTHPMSLSVVLGVGAHLWLCAAPAVRLRRAAVTLAALGLASLPLWLPLMHPRAGLGVLAPSSPKQAWGEHVGQLLGELHRPIGGLLGTHLMIAADGAAAVRPVPAWVPGALLLFVALLLGRVLLSRPETRPAGAAALLATVLLVVLVFFGPARAGPHTLRFLTPAYLPLVALLALGAVLLCGRGALLAALALMCVNLAGAQALWRAWHHQDRAAPPFALPDLAPVAQALRARGLTRVFASYETSYRLTFESGERIVASQPWNERFRHHALPYLDEVRRAPDAAWILAPWSSGVPASDEFEDALRSAGIRCRRIQASRALVYYGCEASFGPEVVSPSEAGAAGDGDPRSALIVSEPQRAVTVTLAAPRALGGVTLLARERQGSLPRGFDLEGSLDGRHFELLGGRRPGDERRVPVFVNGHVEFGVDDAVWSVALDGRPLVALRLVPVEQDQPWSLAELLLHPAGQPSAAATWQVRAPAAPPCAAPLRPTHAGLWRQAQIALRDCPGP